MADDADSKSVGRKPVWVQVPLPALFMSTINTAEMLYLSYFFVFKYVKNRCKNVCTFLHVSFFCFGLFVPIIYDLVEKIGDLIHLLHLSYVCGRQFGHIDKN